jgi:hypothetical protein
VSFHAAEAQDLFEALMQINEGQINLAGAVRRAS